MSDERVKIVGILNLNSDSFYDGGKYIEVSKAIFRAKEMIDQGVDIIEIGGFSTKPGSKVPSIKVELSRILPTLKELDKLEFPISVETYRSEIIEEVILFKNVVMINDTSGLKDESILPILYKNPKIKYVLMHNPTAYDKVNNLNPYYENLITEVYSFFLEKMKLIKKGGEYNNIIFDPGFFFNKGVKENIALIKNLSIFNRLGYPIFVAISRKSIFLKIEESHHNNALIETCIMNYECIKNGAKYIRVHDINEAKLTLTLGELLS